jgi:membrane protein required for colicin V production
VSACSLFPVPRTLRLVNWLSLLLVGVLVLVTWRAYANGFIRELVSLCVAILAIPLAGVFYDNLYRKLHPIITNSDLAYLVSFLAILVGVVIAGQVAAHLLKRAVAMLNLGAADRLAGGAFGFLKAVVLCQVVLIALVAFPEPDLQGQIDDSAVATKMLDATPAVLSVLPATFDRTINGFRNGVNAASAVDGAIATPTPPPTH